MIFLSYEMHGGPLTVNLSGRLLEVWAGETGVVEAGKVILPGRLEICEVETARTWEAPPPPADRLPAEERQRSLRETAILVVGEHGAPGFSGLLCPFLNLPLTVPVDPSLAEIFDELHAALASSGWEKALLSRQPPAGAGARPDPLRR